MNGACLKAASEQIQSMTLSLESLVQQTVAHHRKFKFAVSQFRQFNDHFAATATNAVLTKQQLAAYKYIIQDGYKCFSDMFKQNTLQTWAQTALENSANTVPAELCSLISALQDKSSLLDPEGSLFFDAGSPKWIELHALDLKAVSSSFIQFKNSSSANAVVNRFVNERLKSIDAFLDGFTSENHKLGLNEFSAIPVNYQQWRLKHNDLIKEEEIGIGVTAIVYSGIYKPTGEKVAIKNLKNAKLSGKQLESFRRELSILATATHPSVLRFIGATDSPPFSIVTEWMPGGSLYHDLHENHILDPTDLTIALYDIARGLRFLHSHNIIHRDMKSLNILIDGNRRAKICDFGFSKHVEENQVMTMNVGTPHWMAPELLTSSQADINQYNTKVDVYAYAIVMWEVISEDIPYRGLDPTQIIAQVMMHNLRPIVPRKTPEAYSDLMKRCWATNPLERPSFAEIVNEFKKGNIYLHGCDVDAFMKYVRESSTEEDMSAAQLKSQILRISESGDNLAAFVSLIENEGIKMEAVDECWETLNRFKDPNSELYMRGCISFLKTKHALKIATMFRNQKSVPDYIAAKLALCIPTGDAAVDDALVVVACKFGQQVAALRQVIDPKHIKLCFEVIALKGCDEISKNNVVQCAKRHFASTDKMCVVAAIRCLVGIGRVEAISVDFVKQIIQTTNKTLKIAGYIAICAIAKSGVQIPIEIIDGIASKSACDPFGASVLVSVCNNRESAQHLVSLIEHGLRCPIDVAIKMLSVASKHKEIHQQIVAAAKTLSIAAASSELKMVVSQLENL